MTRAAQRVSLLVPLLLLSAVNVGCKRSKIAQCNQLIEVANQQESRLSAQMNASNGDPAQLESLATAFEHSGRQIAAVQISDPPLLALSRQYQSVITRFVTVARAMASAARAQNIEAMNAAIPQLQQIESEETSSVNRINQYCQSL